MTASGSGAAASGDLSHWLWHDTSIVARRYEKSAGVLFAVQQALGRHPAVCDGAGEFLENCADLLAAEPDDFSSVWRDPYSYFWVRLAYELLDAALRGGGPAGLARAYARELDPGDTASLLSFHLHEFKRLLLGASLRSGRPCAFRTPLVARPPLAIPGTRLSLLGGGRLEILGHSAGRLHARCGSQRIELEADGRPGAAGACFRIAPCPLVRRNALEIWLQPHVHNQYGLGLYRRESDGGFDVQAKHAHLIESALGLLEEHDPASLAQLGRFIRMISLQVRDPDSYTNVSHSDLPGTILVCVTHNVHLLADVLIHELHHNRLFFLEETEPFLEGAPDDLESEARYVSPWRADLRPLHGLLHGAYVFVPTTRFWLRVLAAGQLDEATGALALHKAVAGVAQLRVALRQLRRNARFTAAGSRIFAQLGSDVAALAAELAAANLPENPPYVRCQLDGRVETVECPDGSPLGTREQLILHLRRFGPEDQVEDLLRSALEGPVR